MKESRRVMGWILTLTVVGLFVLPAAPAAVRDVPRGGSIQDVLNLSEAGDVVRVVPRQGWQAYRENIVIPAGVTLITNPAPQPGQQGAAVVLLEPVNPNVPTVTMRIEAGVEQTKLSGFGISNSRSHAVQVLGDGLAELELNSLTGNTGERGAGVYYAGPGELVIRSVLFDNDHADNYGGAVYVSGAARVEFRENWFAMNSAGIYGGAVRLYRVARSTFFRDWIEFCEARYGGAVAVYGGNSHFMSGVTMAEDTADMYGGGLYLGSTDALLWRCLFELDTADHSGGGVYAYSSRVRVVGCAFDENSADQLGGAVCGYKASLYLSSSELEANRARYGGALYAYREEEEPVALYRNTFLENQAAVSGGGVYLYRTAEAEIENNVLIRNEAASGNDIYVYNGEVGIVNNTCVHRHQLSGYLDTESIRLRGTYGGAEVKNNIIAYHHRGVVGDGNQANRAGWNDFWRVSDPLVGVNDIGNNRDPANPRFANVPNDDYHITPGSAAIGAANPAGAPVWDRDGNRRDDAPDRGAYELILP